MNCLTHYIIKQKSEKGNNRMRWNLLKKDKNQYDWVIKYLDDDRKLTAPPYLWTRIRAHINSPEKQKAHIPESGLVNHLLPFSSRHPLFWELPWVKFLQIDCKIN